MINVNVDAALEKFNEGIIIAGQCLEKTLTVGIIKNNPWFDFECRGKRGKLRHALRTFTKGNIEVEASELRTIYT